MYRSCVCVALASSFMLSGVTHTMAQVACRPALTFKEVRFSNAQNQLRTWTAILSVDATSCATSGPFEITFVRLKEMGPDLLFTERFTWRPGMIQVSLDFWWDESVDDFWIGDVPPCGCATDR
jgi:hypothetical protein